MNFRILEAVTNAPCACGSGKLVKNCCLARIGSGRKPAPIPVPIEKITIDQTHLYEPCLCQSGKVYRRCCYPRTFFDLNQPNGGVPEPFLVEAAMKRALKRYAAMPEQFGQMTIDRAEVCDTRVNCAAMRPHGETLKGTEAPPSPWQVEAKYEAIRNANPDGVTEVILTYTYPEPFGMAEGTMAVDADEYFRLIDGPVISVLDLFRGMTICLDDGATGTILRTPIRRYQIPLPPLKHESGMWSSRVIARVKHTSHEILEWRLADQTIRGTPGHIVWSETRKWWVRANELSPGELVRVAGLEPLPVISVGPLRTGLIEVFGIEVEYFHNYYVGRGNNAMLVHNGPPCLVKPVGVNPGHSYPPGVESLNAKKAFRTEVAESTYNNHTYKHLKAKTEAEAKAFSTGKGADAQYLLGVSNNGLEKIALEKGFIVDHGGGYYAYIEFNQPIGYNNGQATTWIRAELSGGVYHGHPVPATEVPQAAKDFFKH